MLSLSYIQTSPQEEDAIKRSARACVYVAKGDMIPPIMNDETRAWNTVEANYAKYAEWGPDVLLAYMQGLVDGRMLEDLLETEEEEGE